MKFEKYTVIGLMQIYICLQRIKLHQIMNQGDDFTILKMPEQIMCSKTAEKSNEPAEY